MTDERLCDEHKKEYLSFGKEKKRSKWRNPFEQMRITDMEEEILYMSPNLLSNRHKPCIDVRLKANRINDDLKIDNGFCVGKTSSIQLLVKNTSLRAAKDVNVVIEGEIIGKKQEFNFKNVKYRDAFTDAFVITPEKSGRSEIEINVQYNYKMTELKKKTAKIVIKVSDNEEKKGSSETIFDSEEGGWD